MNYKEIMAAWKWLRNSWHSDPVKGSETFTEDIRTILNMCDEYLKNAPEDDESEEFAEVFELSTRLSTYADVARGNE